MKPFLISHSVPLATPSDFVFFSIECCNADLAQKKHVGADVLFSNNSVSGWITCSHPFPLHSSPNDFVNNGMFSDQMLQCRLEAPWLCRLAVKNLSVGVDPWQS